jgi:hypothetical protein
VEPSKANAAITTPNNVKGKAQNITKNWQLLQALQKRAQQNKKLNKRQLKL